MDHCRPPGGLRAGARNPRPAFRRSLPGRRNRSIRPARRLLPRASRALQLRELPGCPHLRPLHRLSGRGSGSDSSALRLAAGRGGETLRRLHAQLRAGRGLGLARPLRAHGMADLHCGTAPGWSGRGPGSRLSLRAVPRQQQPLGGRQPGSSRGGGADRRLLARLADRRGRSGPRQASARVPGRPPRRSRRRDDAGVERKFALPDSGRGHAPDRLRGGGSPSRSPARPERGRSAGGRARRALGGALRDPARWPLLDHRALLDASRRSGRARCPGRRAGGARDSPSPAGCLAKGAPRGRSDASDCAAAALGWRRARSARVRSGLPGEAGCLGGAESRAAAALRVGAGQAIRRRCCLAGMRS